MFRTDLKTLTTIANMTEEQAGPGPRRMAKILLSATILDTEERRSRALAIAHIGMNLRVWGRYSESVQGAVNDLSRMIRDGREHEEHSNERIAREAREMDEGIRAFKRQAAAAAFTQ